MSAPTGRVEITAPAHASYNHDMFRTRTRPAFMDLALMACLPGCGSSARSHPVDNRAALAATSNRPPPLADDVATLTQAAHDGEQQTTWPQRVTFLGWTGDHRVAYRALVCDRHRDRHGRDRENAWPARASHRARWYLEAALDHRARTRRAVC